MTIGLIIFLFIFSVFMTIAILGKLSNYIKGKPNNSLTDEERAVDYPLIRLYIFRYLCPAFRIEICVSVSFMILTLLVLYAPNAIQALSNMYRRPEDIGYIIAILIFSFIIFVGVLWPIISLGVSQKTFRKYIAITVFSTIVLLFIAYGAIGISFLMKVIQSKGNDYLLNSIMGLYSYFQLMMTMTIWPYLINTRSELDRMVFRHERNYQLLITCSFLTIAFLFMNNIYELMSVFNGIIAILMMYSILVPIFNSIQQSLKYDTSVKVLEVTDDEIYTG